LFLLFDSGIDPEVLSFIFELKLLYFLGYGLNFKECNICGKKDDLVFSIDYGGLVCGEHLNVNQFSYDALVYVNIMKLYVIDIDKTEIPVLEDSDKIIVRHIVDVLFSDYVGYKTKSRGIIKQIQKY
jgi:DNA repair protein RecO (recombination protein O)